MRTSLMDAAALTRSAGACLAAAEACNAAVEQLVCALMCEHNADAHFELALAIGQLTRVANVATELGGVYTTAIQAARASRGSVARVAGDGLLVELRVDAANDDQVVELRVTRPDGCDDDGDAA